MNKVSAAAIKSRREGAALTQQQAADLVGITIKGWQHYEYGVREIPVPTWRLFCILTTQAPRGQSSTIRKGLAAASVIS